MQKLFALLHGAVDMVGIIKNSRPISEVSTSDSMQTSSITELHQSDYRSVFESQPVLQSSFAVSIFTLSPW